MMEASALAMIYGFIRSYGEAHLGGVDRGMNYGNTHYYTQYGAHDFH